MNKYIYNLIHNLEKYKLEAIKYLYIDVSNIIENNIIDKNLIESTLDNILNFGGSEETELLFNKLCDYYSKIDNDGSKFYLNLYEVEYGQKTNNQYIKKI